MIVINRASSRVSQPLSLYIHIPFCATRCTYCAFNTYTNTEALIPAYISALCTELLKWQALATAPLHTIYFGGGTPSLLSPAQIGQVLAACKASFPITGDVEITLEVNPGSVGLDYFQALRETGVNRLSVGMQSAHENELRLMARDHGALAVPRTIEAARQAGFENLSLDLIFALPFQTIDQWKQSVRAALALRPDHLSMYALELESGTPMTRDVTRGKLPLPDEDAAVEMYEVADAMAAAAGLVQYEISNWARPGAECLHNLQYWRNAPYLGIGAGAHGYVGGIRYENVKPIGQYIELATTTMGKNTRGDDDSPLPPTGVVLHQEKVDASMQMVEHMFTGLRLVREGLSTIRFQDRFGLSVDAVFGPIIDRLAGAGLLRREAPGTPDDRLLLAPGARLVSNQVFRQFFAG